MLTILVMIKAAITNNPKPFKYLPIPGRLLEQHKCNHVDNVTDGRNNILKTYPMENTITLGLQDTAPELPDNQHDHETAEICQRVSPVLSKTLHIWRQFHDFGAI